MSCVTTGLDGKSDLIVTIDPTPETLTIDVKSSVQTLFGRQIRETAERVLAELHVTRGAVTIQDNGALDHVIAARLEAAARQAGLAQRPQVAVPARTSTEKDRLRRTRLYLPGNQPDLTLNAGLFGADSLILDLEDSVAPVQKSDARILVRRTLEMAHQLFPDTEIIVRINPLSSPFGRDDLEEIIPARPHVLLLPKCDAGEDVRSAEALIADIEQRAGIGDTVWFMPLIESVQGVVNAVDIARASSRNVALCFGAEDYTRDLGVPRTREGKETLHARTHVVLAARAAGLQAIDTVFSDVADEEGLRQSCLEAKSIGFVGKGVIHPRQIPLVHDAFAPSAEEIETARTIVAALRQAKAAGSGVIALGSKMVDAPVAERALKVIALAKRLGMPGLDDC